MPFPLEPEWIEKTEQKIGVKLPALYVGRMQESNGGEVSAGGDAWSLYPIRDESDRKRLRRTSNDIVLETESARGFPGFPDGGVAIAGNGTGDQLVLLRSHDLTLFGEAVFLWEHETGEVTRIADSLTDLFS